jgi:hypothetical protein
MKLAWAEDRATVGTDLSADPGEVEARHPNSIGSGNKDTHFVPQLAGRRKHHCTRDLGVDVHDPSRLWAAKAAKAVSSSAATDEDTTQIAATHPLTTA